MCVGGSNLCKLCVNASGLISVTDILNSTIVNLSYF